MVIEIILWLFLLLLLGYLFDKYIKWYLFPKRWGVVEANAIFRSGQLTPIQFKKQVKKCNIDVIVSLLDPLPGNVNYEGEQKIIKENGIEQFVYPLLGDGTGDIFQYASAICKLHECVRNGKVVLIHCAAGTQRTGGVVASYRILVQGKSPIEAVHEMKRYGWRWHKNPILIPFINDHLNQLEDLLIQRNILDRASHPMPFLPTKI
jgi:protein tyrosine phosphatase